MSVPIYYVVFTVLILSVLMVDIPFLVYATTPFLLRSASHSGGPRLESLTKPKQFPCKYFQIHYSLVILTLGLAHSEVLTAS